MGRSDGCGNVAVMSANQISASSVRPVRAIGTFAIA
jgi:hypothetical protein